MNKRRIRTLSLILVTLGLWLIATAMTYHFHHCAFYNDLICGILLILLGIKASLLLSSLYFIPFFMTGCWLHLAPLCFWYPSGMEYLNDSLVGTLVCALSFLFLSQKPPTTEVAIPKGWSHNPSAWSHRIPVIFLALACWFLARYLTAYQLGYISTVWDPLFKDGTMKVLTSKVSKAFPLPDAGLGAFAYFLEALFAWQGGLDRWKTAPWIVLSFGVLALPVGITSIVLIVLQPLVVGAWCFICLVIAFLMLTIVFLSIGEVLATLQCMKAAHAQKKSLWRFLVFGVEQ